MHFHYKVMHLLCKIVMHSINNSLCIFIVKYFIKHFHGKIIPRAFYKKINDSQCILQTQITGRNSQCIFSPVGGGCIIRRLHLSRSVSLPQRVSCKDTKQSDTERLQSWRFWESGVLLHYHYFQFHPDLEW